MRWEKLSNDSIVRFLQSYGFITLVLCILAIPFGIVLGNLSKSIGRQINIISAKTCALPLKIGASVMINGEEYILTETNDYESLGVRSFEFKKE